MLRFILMVIPLILPGLALPDQQQDKPLTVCDDAAVKIAGDKVYSSFDNEVHNILKNETTKSDEKFIPTLSSYIKTANNSCYNDSAADKSVTIFHMLWSFSQRNGAFKGFVNRGGLTWIEAIKEQMIDCVSRAGVTDAGDKYEKLWKKSKLHVNDMSCIDAHKVKICTLKALRAEGLSRWNKTNLANYNYNVLYVSSLFDYMIELCYTFVDKWGGKEATTTTQTPEVLGSATTDEVVNSAKTTHSLLAIVLILAVSGVLYIVYRECQAKPRSWKNTNGTFEMGRRRQSLVNNEMCEAGSLPPAPTK